MLLEQITLDNFTELDGFRWTGPEQPSDDDDLARRFLAFCRSKHPLRRYDAVRSQVCAMAQFGHAAGIEKYQDCRASDMPALVWEAISFGGGSDEEREKNWRFGKLADRLEAALDGES